MLLQFSVENYKSFKNMATLSMEASSDKEHPNNVTTINKDRCLNTAVIFGANAAGKSNIFKALTAAILLIRNSNRRQVAEPMLEIVPFLFDSESSEQPTSFEFVFYADDKKYIYGFSATQKEIQKEYLYVYNTSKISTVFERYDVNKYRFTKNELKKQLSPIIERNTENKLFLATATSWNCEATRAAYLWFETKIDTHPTDFTRLFPKAASMFDNDKDNSLRHFTSNLLHEADINIDNFEVDFKDIVPDQFLQQLSLLNKQRMLAMKKPLETGKEIKIETFHKVEENGEVKEYSLSFGDESDGTKNVFLFSPILKQAFETGKTVCIDEFDASLHPVLVQYLVSLFNNPSVNKSKAQLIVSSHSMVLMSLDNLRRDQIYFVEKNKKTAVSELYSLDEFSPRKEEDIRKAYLLGRYGSLPDISEEANLWE